jgi:hypothetical protein
MERNGYTLGWICALPIEMTAAVGMLDECDDSLPQSPYHHNDYILGRVGPHNVAIVCASRNDGLDVCDKDGQSDALGLYSVEVRVCGGYWRRCAKQRE